LKTKPKAKLARDLRNAWQHLRTARRLLRRAERRAPATDDRLALADAAARLTKPKPKGASHGKSQN
jgi:hypothetical protein